MKRKSHCQQENSSRLYLLFKCMEQVMPNKFESYTRAKKTSQLIVLFHVLQNTFTEKALNIGISRTIRSLAITNTRPQLGSILFYQRTAQ